MSDEHGPGLLRQWTAPPTVIAIVVASVTMYGGWVVQQERLDVLRVRIEAVERDFARREVLAVELQRINDRLYSIEQKLGSARSPLLQ